MIIKDKLNYIQKSEKLINNISLFRFIREVKIMHVRKLK